MRKEWNVIIAIYTEEIKETKFQLSREMLFKQQRPFFFSLLSLAFSVPSLLFTKRLEWKRSGPTGWQNEPLAPLEGRHKKQLKILSLLIGLPFREKLTAAKKHPNVYDGLLQYRRKEQGEKRQM